MNVSEMSDEYFYQHMQQSRQIGKSPIFQLLDLLLHVPIKTTLGEESGDYRDYINTEILAVLENIKNESDPGINNDVKKSIIDELYLHSSPVMWKTVYDSNIFPREDYIHGAIIYAKPTVLKFLLDDTPEELIKFEIVDPEDVDVGKEVDHSYIEDFFTVNRALRYFPLLSVLLLHPKTQNKVFAARGLLLKM